MRFPLRSSVSRQTWRGRGGPVYSCVVPQQLSRRSALAGFGGAAALTLAACGRVTADAAMGVAAARRPGGTLLWRSQAAPAHQPGIVAAAGRVYVTGGGQSYGDSGIYAFDAAGRRLWRTSGSSGPYPYAASASAVYGFTVTPGGATTEVSASDAATGRRLWTHDAGRMLDSAEVGWLAYSAGLVYVAAGTTEDSTSGQPAVRALDARTGRLVWRAFAGPTPQLPAVAGGLVFAEDAASGTAASGYLVALDAATGARRWRSANLGGLVYSPVVLGGIACCTGVSLTHSRTFALDTRTGREIWQAPVLGLALAGTQDIVFLVEFFIGPTLSFTIWARHIRTGALAWTRHFPGQPVPAAAGGVLYLGHGTGTVQAIAAATGQPRWTRQLRASPADLAVGDGVVYAVDQNGGVYAVQA
jgi:outer membrane protein assembly factor BamB